MNSHKDDCDENIGLSSFEDVQLTASEPDSETDDEEAKVDARIRKYPLELEKRDSKLWCKVCKIHMKSVSRKMISAHRKRPYHLEGRKKMKRVKIKAGLKPCSDINNTKQSEENLNESRAQIDFGEMKFGDTIQLEPGKSLPDVPFTCSECSATFTTEEYLKLHETTHKNCMLFPCGKCDRVFSNQNALQAHTKRNHEGFSDDNKKKFACLLCDYSTNHKSHFVKHNFIHYDVRPHKCDRCDKGFTVKSALLQHISSVHDKKTYQCEFCQKDFTQLSSKKQHISIVHNNEKSHVCPHCGKNFAHFGHLKNHIRTHTKEKPFKCSQCEKGFARKSVLTAHLVNVHKQDFPHKCQFCNQGFLYPKQLKQHVQAEHGALSL